MEVKCEYCGSMIPDDVPSCPNCGAPNENMHRAADGTPKTIAELKAWYKKMNLPPAEVTRFFIGENYLGPRAYGIYKDRDNYIVYKNKADGTKVIRYKGKDEDYAVNELYLKLKAEILHQKEGQSARPSHTNYNPQVPKSTPRRAWRVIIIIAAIVLALMVFSRCSLFFPYFSSGSSDSYWHNYDTNDNYYDSYSYGNDYSYDYGNSYDSYDSYDSWDSDWDSDYSWDSNDSWDSDWGSDWDSDW